MIIINKKIITCWAAETTKAKKIKIKNKDFNCMLLKPIKILKSSLHSQCKKVLQRRMYKIRKKVFKILIWNKEMIVFISNYYLVSDRIK